jgi:hypothetical protein
MSMDYDFTINVQYEVRYRRSRVVFRAPTPAEWHGWKKFGEPDPRNDALMYRALCRLGVNEPTNPIERQAFIRQALKTLFDFILKEKE